MEIWSLGKVEEFNRGDFAKVVHVDGHYAILQQPVVPSAGYEFFIAQADHEDRGNGDFPWSFVEELPNGEPKRYSNLSVAILALIAAETSAND